MAGLKCDSLLSTLVGLIFSAVLGACGAQGIDVAGIAGSASMQIDVEVYKGPLSKELDIQKSELIAKLYESEVAVEVLVGQTRIAMCSLACFDRRGGGKSHKRYPVEDSDAEEDFYQYARPQFLAPDKKMFRHNEAKAFCAQRIYDVEIERPADEQHDVCPVLDVMDFDLRSIKGRFRLLGLGQITEVFADDPRDPENDPDCVQIGYEQYSCYAEGLLTSKIGALDDSNVARKFFLNAANYGEFLRSRAAFVATQQTAIAPNSKRARRAIANFAQFLADYGNQIGARADAILKQEALFKHDNDQTSLARKTLLARELLANTTYLRDSAPTGYLNLYKFNDASAADSLRGATDRIRLVEQLTADTYWTRINSVFAAGQGEATMAFVKDDIGNWDLKKFDNRPGQLVDAYKSAGLAVLQEVATAASGGVAGLGDASQLLGFADRLNFGGEVASNAQVDAQVERLRQRTSGRLERLKTTEQDRYAELTESLEAARVAVAATKGEVEEQTAAAAAATAELNEAVSTEQQAREELAALEGEKRGLEEALLAAGEGQRAPIESRIAAVDARISIQRGRLDNTEALVSLQDQKTKIAQAALEAGNDKLQEQEANLASLESRQALLPTETARFARQILDNYLATLEELAEARAASPSEAAALSDTN